MNVSAPLQSAAVTERDMANAACIHRQAYADHGGQIHRTFAFVAPTDGTGHFSLPRRPRCEIELQEASGKFRSSALMPVNVGVAAS